MSGRAVSVIIPAFNEERGVKAQVESIARMLSAAGMAHEIIVIDDGSSDRTAQEALAGRARVLQHPQNTGYGASLKTGILAAQNETIVISDADGTYPAQEIPALVEKLDTADMVVGARTGANVHVPLVRRPAKWVLTWVASHVAGGPIPDLNSGLRAFRRDCVKQYFPILSNRFSFTTTATLALLADNYRVLYHPIDYYQRVGKSKIVPRDFVDFVILVIRMAMLFQPLKVFVPLATLSGILGVLKVVYDIFSVIPRTGSFDWSILYRPVVSTSAFLILLVALQLLLIGMLADGVIRRIGLHNEPLASSHGVRQLELGGQAVDEEDAKASGGS